MRMTVSRPASSETSSYIAVRLGLQGTADVGGVSDGMGMENGMQVLE